MLDLNQNFIYTFNLPLRQFALNLLGKSADLVKLVGKVMDEGNLLYLAEEKGSSSLRSIVYFYRMVLEVFFGEYERAAETAELNKNVDKDNMGRFSIVVNHCFYHGLSALILARRQGRSKWEDTISKAMTQMKKWTSANLWNCEHKLALMNAEYAYLEGDINIAIQAYDCAIVSAAKHRFVHEEGLALERAGIFYLETGDNATASRLIHRAHDCYVRWEAHSKAAHVKQHF
uniref:KIF-binding protein n=1 Tax=Odontella aurita TaxID=265563 RepID=A0A7S4ICG1_9STRA|mmetsp:Transcript_23095/g.68129  ORF Transcript_23095/g.68129 Transcript_23095/m.68129 type:complete len:231 (+) Transcript_23095:2-694(+)